jgi:hypothetical protein
MTTLLSTKTKTKKKGKKWNSYKNTFALGNTMYSKISIIISVILVTAAILTVQSSSMLQPSYSQLCPDGSTPDASGNCPTEAPPAGPSYSQLCPDGSTPDASGNCPTEAPPAGDGEIQTPPPAGDGETQTPPPAGDGETAQAPPPATTETPPPPAAEAPPAGTSQGSNNTGGMSAEWANSILAVHNSERAAVGVPPLVWSDSLAAGAQTWAEQVSQTGIFGHSTCCGAFRDYGENIAGFFWDEGPTAPGGGTSLFVDEKKNYHGQPVEETGGAPDATYAHYTQMVWRSTTQIGCGAAPPGVGGLPYSILVCQYIPPGNIFTQAPY